MTWRWCWCTRWCWSPRLAVGALFAAASLLFGRKRRCRPLPQATTATTLPAFGVTRADVDAVKFTQVLRGYKTSEVDWSAGFGSAVSSSATLSALRRSTPRQATPRPESDASNPPRGFRAVVHYRS